MMRPAEATWRRGLRVVRVVVRVLLVCTLAVLLVLLAVRELPRLGAPARAGSTPAPALIAGVGGAG